MEGRVGTQRHNVQNKSVGRSHHTTAGKQTQVWRHTPTTTHMPITHVTQHAHHAKQAALHALTKGPTGDVTNQLHLGRPTSEARSRDATTMDQHTPRPGTTRAPTQSSGGGSRVHAVSQTARNAMHEARQQGRAQHTLREGATVRLPRPATTSTPGHTLYRRVKNETNTEHYIQNREV